MFRGWENFYLLVGSAAGALIGLLFVVVTLTAGSERARIQRGQALYMTPTVVHFAAVLSIAALAMVPGVAPGVVGGLLITTGLAGGVYGGVTAWRIQAGGSEHWSDVWFYGCLPATAYLALAGCGGGVLMAAGPATYAVAALGLTLLFIGVRNAWDLVTWLAPRRSADPADPR